MHGVKCEADFLGVGDLRNLQHVAPLRVGDAKGAGDNENQKALRAARDDSTAQTNVFSGRPARSLMNRIMREIGPMSDLVPAFPTAGGALAPLKAAAEARGVSDFSSLWSGQVVGLCHETGAGDLTRQLAEDAARRLRELALPG